MKNVHLVQSGPDPVDQSHSLFFGQALIVSAQIVFVGISSKELRQLARLANRIAECRSVSVICVNRETRMEFEQNDGKLYFKNQSQLETFEF
jgi:hypothetical protein